MQLLDVQVNQFHCYVVTCYGAIKETHSQFKIIASCLVEGFGEIWRIVERATCTGGVTVFTIPESVIGVESVLFQYPGHTYPDSQ